METAEKNWRELTNDEVLDLAPMQGSFSQDEKDAFAGGFRRAVELMAEECARMCESVGGMAGDYWAEQCANAIRERFAKRRADQ